MKKAIIAILMLVITFSIFLGTGTVAYAQNETADTTFSDDVKGQEFRVPQGQSYIVYKVVDGTETPLFRIPETYYFKYVKSNPNGDKKFIEYNGITSGIYIKESGAMALTEKDVSPLGGFTLNVTFDNTVSYYYIDEFFAEDTLSSPDTLTITFLGFAEEFSYGSTVTLQNPAFVKVGETYGFIDSALLKVKGTSTLLSSYINKIPLHTNYQTKINDETNTSKSEVNSNKLIRTILIIGICVPALIIVLLLFKPSKHNRYDYDRNQREASGTSPYDQPRSRYRDDYYDEPRRRRNDQYDNDDYYDDRRR